MILSSKKYYKIKELFQIKGQHMKRMIKIFLITAVCLCLVIGYFIYISYQTTKDSAEDFIAELKGEKK